MASNAGVGSTGRTLTLSFAHPPGVAELVRHESTVITYTDSLNNIQGTDLEGFLAHWDFRPPEGTLLTILKQSSVVILARDVSSSVVCGYVAALSDGVACGYISFLEVRSEFRGKGIGSALLTQMTDRLRVYGVYLSCAPSMAAFYTSRGFAPVTGMSKRMKPLQQNA